MLTSCDTYYGVYDEHQECPEETRDESKGATKGLHGETGGVGIGDVVCTRGGAWGEWMDPVF